MLDFTSALYLGLTHASGDLPGWKQLTLGKPAALKAIPRAAELEQKLAALMGCERAVLATSTLHLFWDLFSIFGRKKINIFLDSHSYPILRWGVERAACLGAAVHVFRQHDTEALRSALQGASDDPPVIVTDGYCPACGKLAPLKEFLLEARSHGGLVVVDDTQALGIFGKPVAGMPYGAGGGGSLRRAGLMGSGILVGASLAKAFGAPLAVFAGDTAAVDDFKRRSATRVHCSPPSSVVIAAATRALKINSLHGDKLRLKLARTISRFRRGLSRMGMIGTRGLFPVQSLSLPDHISAETLNRRLLRAGVATVVLGEGKHERPRISFVVTARHTVRDIDLALARLAEVTGCENLRCVSLVNSL